MNKIKENEGKTTTTQGIIVTFKALAYAIRNQTVSKRNTKLKERLNDRKYDTR